VLFANYNYVYYMKDDEIGRSYSTCVKDDKMIQNIIKLQGKRPYGNPRSSCAVNIKVRGL
jgi:hypothetical protein